MAQRKPPSASTRKPGARPATPAVKASPGRPPARKPGKSIVNQRQTPWGLIITTIVLVLFAGAIVTYAVTRNHGSGMNEGTCTSGGNTCYVRPEIDAAKKISGVIYKKEPNHNHVNGVVHYNASPPIGGNHSPFWANCTGTVYTHQIANENAVHMLEHGAVWITYREGLPAAQVDKLKQLVAGQQYIAMSPYPNLKTKVSLQTWGYQLFVNSVTDPRIAQFIGVLDHNASITPEYGASCSQPTFKQHPSTFGHPLWVPVSGTPNLMTTSATP